MNTDLFKTIDLNLAAWLNYQGKELLFIEKEGNRGTFVFGAIEPALLKEYNSSAARVEPKKFGTITRHLTRCVRSAE